MSEELTALLDQCNKLYENEQFDALNNILTERVLADHQHPIVFHYKCLALDQLDADPEELLSLAQLGLDHDDNYTGLLEFQYINQMKLSKHKEAVASAALLCELEPHNYDYYFWQANALTAVNASQEAQRIAAQGYLQTAFHLLEQGEHDNALEQAHKALEADTGLRRARLLEGEIHYYTAQYEQAEEIMTDLLAAPEYEIDALEFLAKIAENNNELDALENYSRKLLQLDPHHSYALRARAKLALRREQMLELFDGLDSALGEHPDDIWCHLTRFAFAGHLANDEAFLLASHHREVLYRLIEVLIDGGMYEAGVRKLAQLPPEDPRYMATVEKAAWKLWRYEQHQLMCEALEHACAQADPNARLYGLLAEARSYTDSMNRGLETIALGEQIDPGDAMLVFFKAKINADLWMNHAVEPFPEDLAKSLEPGLIQWLDSHPHDGYAQYHLAGVYYTFGDYQQALEFIEHAYDDGLSHCFMLYWWARILYRCGELKRALDVFDDKFEKRSYESSQKPRHYATKARILAELGETQKLTATVDEIRRRWPQYADASFDDQAEQWQRLATSDDAPKTV